MAVDPVVILGATALGGAISFSTTYAMTRRAERAAARATARILRDDLSLGAAMIGVVLTNDKWWPYGYKLPTRAWHEDRLPLARYLSDTKWRTLAQAFDDMNLTNALLDAEARTLPEELEPAGRTKLEGTLAAVNDASRVLDRFGG